MKEERLTRQIEFLLEIDRLKSVLRRTYIPGADRRENSAEHSWHLAVMAAVLSEHSNAEIDVGRVVRMALVHDVVEIDAGDTFCYDEEGNRGKVERERKAAERIFGLLPADQREEMRALWEEFEARETPEAKFAAGLDRLMPLLHNYQTRGRSWREHGITKGQVVDRNRHIGEGSERLWAFAEGMIEDAVEKGYLSAVPSG